MTEVQSFCSTSKSVLLELQSCTWTLDRNHCSRAKMTGLQPHMTEVQAENRTNPAIYAWSKAKWHITEVPCKSDRTKWLSFNHMKFHTLSRLTSDIVCKVICAKKGFKSR